MNGIIISIDPVIFHLGAFEFRWYSLVIMLAVVSAILISTHVGKKKGIAAQEIYSLALWVVIAGMLGARLFHVIDQFDFYLSNPLLILQFQQGGLAIWGGLAGGGLALILYARSQHLSLSRLVDVVTPGFLVAQIIGRFGCIINGDAPGGIANLPWSFIYTHPNALIPSNLFGLPTHPYPVYEIIWNALALLVILQIGRHFKKDGLVFLSSLPLYSLGRFILTFVRQENITLWGLQQAQLIALFTLAASVAALLYLTGKKLSPEKI